MKKSQPFVSFVKQASKERLLKKYKVKEYLTRQALAFLQVLFLFSQYDSVIMTIPGIGYINGGMILCEIGNIHRFSSPGKLLAFASLDPSVYHIDRSPGGPYLQCPDFCPSPSLQIYKLLS